MKLELLQETSNASIFYDCTNQWLFVDWHGDLTLPLVQASCLSIAQRFLEGPCTRVLNNNTGVSSIAPDVPGWLAKEFLPHLRLAGVEYVAWVYSPVLRVKSYTDAAISRAPNAPMVAMFDDLESAFAWLRNTRFDFLEESVVVQGAQVVKGELQYRIETLSGLLTHGRAAASPAG